MEQQVNTQEKDQEEENGLPKTQDWEMASYNKEMESQFQFFLKMQMYEQFDKNSLIA